MHIGVLSKPKFTTLNLWLSDYPGLDVNVLAIVDVHFSPVMIVLCQDLGGGTLQDRDKKPEHQACSKKRTERRALTIWHALNKHVGSKWCPKARSVHENSNFLLTHSQSTNTSPTRGGLMLSDKTTLSGSNAQSKYSNHWDMNHNQPFWVAKNHEVVNIKVDRRPAAPHNAGYCHWLTLGTP